MRLQWLHCILAVVQLSSVISQHCSLPTQNEIEQVLQISDSLPGRTSTNTLDDYVFTCLAVEAQDLYSSLSVAVRFTASGQGSTFYYTQFQMHCTSSNLAGTSFQFNLQEGFESGNSAVDAYNAYSGGGGPDAKSRKDCSSCTRTGTGPSYNDIANCVECSETCQDIGMGSCQNNNQTDCCPFFDASGSCTTDHTCLDSNPCQNGGMCNVAGPLETDYNCSCMASYGGTNCENITNICHIQKLCMNGGTCVFGTTDTQYECLCSGRFTGDHCDEMVSSGSGSGSGSGMDRMEISPSSTAGTSSPSPIIVDDDDDDDIGETFTVVMSPSVMQSSPPQPPVPTFPTLVVGSAVGGGVVAAFVAFWCLLIFVVFGTKLRRRRRKKDEKDKKPFWMSDDLVEPGSQQLARFPMKIAGISRSNSFFSQTIRILEALSRPIMAKDIGKEVTNEAKLHAEFMSILSNMVTMNEVPTGAEEKNRYRDVLPNPHSRVPLFLKFGVPHSDYINANYVRGYTQHFKSYIATQAPLPTTVNDFWRMIWEQKCSMIIMVTNLEEDGKNKCCQYWPDSSKKGLSETHGELEIVSRKRTVSENHTVTTLLLRHLERHVTREVFHYWFTKWPDHGVPATTGPFIDFVLETRKAVKGGDTFGPVVVHCSSGISRTGVFIGADTGMRDMENENKVDVLRIVSSLRQDKGGMVQTKDQYVFLHKILYDYAMRIGRVPTESLGYENRLAFEEESGIEDNGTSSQD